MNLKEFVVLLAVASAVASAVVFLVGMIEAMVAHYMQWPISTWSWMCGLAVGTITSQIGAWLDESR